MGRMCVSFAAPRGAGVRGSTGELAPPGRSTGGEPWPASCVNTTSLAPSLNLTVLPMNMPHASGFDPVASVAARHVHEVSSHED